MKKIFKFFLILSLTFKSTYLFANSEDASSDILISDEQSSYSDSFGKYDSDAGLESLPDQNSKTTFRFKKKARKGIFVKPIFGSMDFKSNLKSKVKGKADELKVNGTGSFDSSYGVALGYSAAKTRGIGYSISFNYHQNTLNELDHMDHLYLLDGNFHYGFASRFYLTGGINAGKIESKNSKSSDVLDKYMSEVIGVGGQIGVALVITSRLTVDVLYKQTKWNYETTTKNSGIETINSVDYTIGGSQFGLSYTF